LCINEFFETEKTISALPISIRHYFVSMEQIHVSPTPLIRKFDRETLSRSFPRKRRLMVAISFALENIFDEMTWFSLPVRRYSKSREMAVLENLFLKKA